MNLTRTSYVSPTPKGGSMQADCATVVEVRPIMCAKCRLPVLVFMPKLTHPAVELFAIAELLVYICYCLRRLLRTVSANSQI